MAETIKLQVELENKINQSKQIASELKSQGGFKGNPKAEQSIALITQELESLAKISNPTLKNLSRIEVLFDQLSEILLKVAQTTKTTTEEFKRIEKELADLQGKESELKKRRSALFKEGRVNKDSGKYELYNTYQDEVVAKAGIKNAKGVDIKRSSTFLSKFDETGNPIQGAFQDPAAAKKIYDELLATQTKNADELREINEALATYKIKIEQKTQELEGQGQSENNTLPSKIISNKTQVNRLIDSEKEQVHSEEDQKKLTTSIEGTTAAIQKQTSSLGRAFKQFTIYNIAIKAVRMALNEAKQTIKELDKYLTEQAMVTGKTREQTYKLIDSYQNLALQCGATTKEIAEVATEYMKQGKTIEDSLVLTEAAVKAAKVARVSVGDSVNYLTTALNGFRLEADQAMAVSDKFAAIAAASATDYDELAIALSKVASQANLAGMSIDYTTALLTKGLETTREAPETMGTALKTIIARMRELGDYGETLDDGMDINNVESQLKYVGIALRDSNGELRSTEEVLDELGHKWDDLNKNQQAAIAKALAGTRQQSRLIAMMEDYERVSELQQISQRSAGATAAQAGVFLEGMEASLNNIQVAWEKIVMTLTNSKIIIGTLDIAGKALDKIGDSLKDTGKQVGLFTTLAAIGALMLGNKLREHDIAKQEHKLALERSIIEQKAAIEKRQNFIDNSTQVLKDQQAQEIKKANNEIVLAQEKELGLQEEHNKAVAAEAAAEKKVAQTELIAQKWEQQALDDKTIANAEDVYAWELEQQAAEDISLAKAEEKFQLEQEALKLKLQEKALTEEGLTAQEQALLNNIDNEIAASKEREQAARNQAKYSSAQAEAARDVAKAAEDEYKKSQKIAKLQRGKADSAKKELDSAKKLTKTTADNLNNAKKITTEKEKNLTDLQATHKKQLEDNASQIEAAKQLLKLDEEKLNLLYEQQGGLMGIFGLWNRLKGLMLLFKPIYAGVLFFQKLINKEKNKEYVATLRQQAAEAKGFRKKLLNAAASAAESVAANPFWGWAAAIAILAAVGIGIGVAIAKNIQYNKSAEGTAEKINELSNEIYKLNEQAQAIDNITNSFDKLDKKLIKTKEDLAEMNSLLEKGSEIMDDSIGEDEDKGFGKGVSEKQYYDSLTNEEKKIYLARKRDQIDVDLAAKRQAQKDLISNMDASERQKLLSSTATDPKIIQAQAAIYALNNQEIYDNMDILKESKDLTDDAAASIEGMTQSLLENLTAEEAWEFADHPGKVQKLTEALADLETQAKSVNGKMLELSSAEVLASDDYSLKDRVESYQEIIAELESMGAEYESVLESFKKEYSGFEKLGDFSKNALDFMDSTGISTDDINSLWGAWEGLRKQGVNITQEEWEGKFTTYMEALATTQGDVLTATKSIFGEYLDDSKDALNAFVSAYGDLVQVGILNMGQNMDKVKNSINNFYEKALEWNTMSESDRAEFLQDNAELFSGKGGEELLNAFQSGNYESIEKALSENKTLQDQLEKRRQEVKQELLIERARDGEDRNEAYIAQLEEYERYLNDVENLFKASLEVRLEQEKEQIDAYKSYLEDQQEALEESLEKRKEAYEKYFDAIDQKEEDEDYEEEANLLISNLSKLSSSTNASAQQEVQKMEKELAKLEEERLKELRERAQEAILENMDDELEEISQKFDKLLESNHALLLAMKGDLENPGEFISNMITKEISDGKTSLEMEQYINELQTTFGSVLGNTVDWEILKEEIHQLFLNVNGQTINLTNEEQQNIYEAVEKALTQIGAK